MNDYLWHIDRAFLYVVDKPLIILGAVFAVLVAVTIGLVVYSRRDRDDA